MSEQVVVSILDIKQSTNITLCNIGALFYARYRKWNSIYDGRIVQGLRHLRKIAGNLLRISGQKKATNNMLVLSLGVGGGV